MEGHDPPPMRGKQVEIVRPEPNPGRYSKQDPRSRSGVTLPETRITVRLPFNLRRRVVAMQRDTGLSQSEVIRLALEQIMRREGTE